MKSILRMGYSYFQVCSVHFQSNHIVFALTMAACIALVFTFELVLQYGNVLQVCSTNIELISKGIYTPMAISLDVKKHMYGSFNDCICCQSRMQASEGKLLNKTKQI